MDTLTDSARITGGREDSPPPPLRLSLRHRGGDRRRSLGSLVSSPITFFLIRQLLTDDGLAIAFEIIN